MSIQNYALGCPMWSHKAWRGLLFSADARPTDFLAQYSSVFNAVEGNTTFYAVPSAATVDKWRAAADGFEFCFKLPQRITHEAQLRHCDEELLSFLRRIEPLQEKLGVLMIQLPAEFGPAALPQLEAFLRRLPAGFGYAVEVRHGAFFAKGEAERALNRLLRELGMERVMLDSRALFSTPPTDPAMQDAQGKKPRLPLHVLATGQRPLVRFIGHQQLALNHRFLQPWLDKLALWIAQGLRPYMFIHTPDNVQAPLLARWFHAQLAARIEAGELPPSPAEQRVQMTLL